MRDGFEDRFYLLQHGNAVVVADVLLDRFRIQHRLFKEEPRVLGHCGDRDHALLIHRQDFFERVAVRLFDREIGDGVEAFDGVGEAVEGGFADVFAVHPGEFFAVEAAGGFLDAVEGEEVEHFGSGDDFAVFAGSPADEGDEIEQRLGEIAGAAEILDVDFGEFGVGHGGEFDGDFDGVGFLGHEVLHVFERDAGAGGEVGVVFNPAGLDGGAGHFGLFALGHFGVVHVEHEWEVAVLRRGPAKGFVEA